MPAHALPCRCLIALRSQRSQVRILPRVLSRTPLPERVLAFPDEAAPFDWIFTRNDLNLVLAKIADREPDLRLAA